MDEFFSSWPMTERVRHVELTSKNPKVTLCMDATGEQEPKTHQSDTVSDVSNPLCRISLSIHGDNSFRCPHNVPHLQLSPFDSVEARRNYVFRWRVSSQMARTANTLVRASSYNSVG